VLSSAATTEVAKKIALLSSQVFELQDSLAGITSTIGELKEHQRQDQLRMNGLQANMEMVNKKTETATKEIRKCNSIITNTENLLSNLMTKEETTKRFDTLEAMFTEIAGSLRKNPPRNLSLNGETKRD
jgi:chromosome segregation ATPase